MFRHSSCSAPSYKIKYVTDSIDHENRIMLDALGLTIIGFCFCFLLAFFFLSEINGIREKHL